MAGQQLSNDPYENNPERLAQPYGYDDGVAVSPVGHATTSAIPSTRNEDSDSLGRQRAQSNRDMPSPTKTKLATSSSLPQGSSTSKNFGGEGTGLLTTASTGNASFVLDGRSSSREYTGMDDEVIGATEPAPSTRQDLPSGHHHDSAIQALLVQPHLAKGPCWRCKPHCKECTWQHPMEHCHLQWTKRPKRIVEQMQHCPRCHRTGCHTNNCPYHKSNDCGKCGMRGGHHLLHCSNRGSRPPPPPVGTGLQLFSVLQPIADELCPSDVSEVPSAPVNNDDQDPVDQPEPANSEEDDHVSEDQEDAANEEEIDSVSEAGKNSAKRKLSDDEDDKSPRPVRWRQKELRLNHRTL